LTELINTQVKDKVKRYGKAHLNPNSVGGGYEKVVRDLLRDYLGSRLEFYTRAQIVDAKMQYMKVLPHGSGEIDVVGIFNNTTPKIVLKLDEDQVLLPYDAVALLCEVKSELDSQKLEKDLIKLKNIGQLELSPNRFKFATMGIPGNSQQSPFRLLVYFNTSIDNVAMERKLNEYSGYWDVVYIVNSDTVISNKSLTFVQTLLASGIKKDTAPDNNCVYWDDSPVAALLLLLSQSIPVPLVVDVMITLLNITALALSKESNQTSKGK
jgi:hypothetical protein